MDDEEEELEIVFAKYFMLLLKFRFCQPNDNLHFITPILLLIKITYEKNTVDAGLLIFYSPEHFRTEIRNI